MPDTAVEKPPTANDESSVRLEEIDFQETAADHKPWALSTINLDCIQDEEMLAKAAKSLKNNKKIIFGEAASSIPEKQLSICQAHKQAIVDKAPQHRTVRIGDKTSCLPAPGQPVPTNNGCRMFGGLVAIAADVRQEVLKIFTEDFEDKLNQLVTGPCAKIITGASRETPCAVFASVEGGADAAPAKKIAAAMKAGKSRVDKISDYYFMALSACYQGPSGCTMDAMGRFNWVALRTTASGKAETALGNRRAPAAQKPEQAKIVAEFLALIIAEDLAKTGRGTFAGVVTTPDKKKALKCVPLMHGQTGFNIGPSAIAFDDTRQACVKEIGSSYGLRLTRGLIMVG